MAEEWREKQVAFIGKPPSWGMRVRIRWSAAAPVTFPTLHGLWTERRNVTEIHWRYPGAPTPTRVAFESDIHCTRDTIPVEWIAEFEATVETERAPDFWTPGPEVTPATAR